VRLEINDPVCVTVTVLVTPVGNVVGELVNVPCGLLPVGVTVEDFVNTFERLFVGEPVCVRLSLELEETVVVLNIVLVGCIDIDGETLAVDVLEA